MRVLVLLVAATAASARRGTLRARVPLGVNVGPTAVQPLALLSLRTGINHRAARSEPDSSGALQVQLQTDLQKVQAGMTKVSDMIAKQEAILKEMDARPKPPPRRQNATSHSSQSPEIAMAERRFRQHITHCLEVIRGGAEVVYHTLRNFLRTVKTDEVCLVMKQLKFPEFASLGHTNVDYNGKLPDPSGREHLYFGAAKNAIFKCMCEWSNSAVLPPGPTQEEHFAKQLAEAQDGLDLSSRDQRNLDPNGNEFLPLSERYISRQIDLVNEKALSTGRNTIHSAAVAEAAKDYY